MKIRQGFVTNSSSSSYVIARKSTMGNDQIRAYFMEDFDSIKGYIADQIKYIEEDELPDDIRGLSVEEIANQMIVEGIRLFNDVAIDLDTWKIITFTASGEDGWYDAHELLKVYIYDNGLRATDDLKISEESC